jgi:glycosyltransferase involved in cell wall biosynthesis
MEGFLSASTWRVFYRRGHAISKLEALVKGFFRRISLLFMARKFDYIFIHREAMPFGPPVFEWTLAKILRKKIIYDFDDAIWLTDRSSESFLLRAIKWRSKVRRICRWAYKVSVGNEYLGDFARRSTRNVVLNPTTIDTSKLHNPDLHTGFNDDGEVVIGWTGSHTTIKYLKIVEPALQLIESRYSQVRIQVIADKRPELSVQSIRFNAWSRKTEVDDLIKIDIGIMPLPDDEWAQGKCGFKALQYMALAKPVVASPVGVNTEIIENGKNGFLCTTHDEWVTSLSTLVENKLLRNKMGVEGRKIVQERYSVDSNAANFASLFE